MTPVWVFPAYPLLLSAPFAGNLIYSATHVGEAQDMNFTPIAFCAVAVQGTGFLISFMICAAFLYRLMTQKLPRDMQRPGVVSVDIRQTLNKSAILIPLTSLIVHLYWAQRIYRGRNRYVSLASFLPIADKSNASNGARLPFPPHSPARSAVGDHPAAGLRGRGARRVHPAGDLDPGRALALGPERLVLPRVGRVAVEVRPAREHEHDALPDDLVVLRLPQHGAGDGDAGAGPRAWQRRPARLRLRHGRLPRRRLGPRLRHHDPLPPEQAAAVAQGAGARQTVVYRAFSFFLSFFNYFLLSTRVEPRETCLWYYPHTPML